MIDNEEVWDKLQSESIRDFEDKVLPILQDNKMQFELEDDEYYELSPVALIDGEELSDYELASLIGSRWNLLYDNDINEITVYDKQNEVDFPLSMFNGAY